MHAASNTLQAYQAKAKIVKVQLTPAKFAAFLKARWLAFVATLSVLLGVLYPALVTHASTTITIDTDVLFSAVNGWITTFLPIAAIGLGIAIALAVIAFVGDAILQGFKRH